MLYSGSTVVGSGLGSWSRWIVDRPTATVAHVVEGVVEGGESDEAFMPSTLV